MNQNYPKWLPRDIQDTFYLFDELNEVTKLFQILSNRIASEFNFIEPDTHVS